MKLPLAAAAALLGLTTAGAALALPGQTAIGHGNSLTAGGTEQGAKDAALRNVWLSCNSRKVDMKAGVVHGAGFDVTAMNCTAVSTSNGPVYRCKAEAVCNGKPYEPAKRGESGASQQ